MRSNFDVGDLLENKRHNWRDYILVFVLLCFSGNPFFLFSPVVREMYIALTILLCILVIFKKRDDVFIKYFTYTFPLALIMMYHLLAISGASASNNMFMLIKYFIGVSIICLLGKKFIYVYVEIMTVLSVISLFFWLYTVFFGLIPGAIAVSEGASSIIVHTQDIYNVQAGTSRNSGMFWEPGAYQGFLNLALLFLLKMDNINRKKLRFLILILGVLSTQSTTGYIVMMLVLYVYVVDNKRIKGAAKVFLLLFLLAAAYYTYSELPFLSDKIEDNLSDTTSSQGRVTDFLIYKNLIEARPLLGNSYNSEVVSGNGFFYQIVSIGFIGTLYLFIILFAKVYKKTTLKFSLLFLLVIIVMFQGEVFVVMPLFMALPFVEFPNRIKTVAT
jgi:hypothetical protein